MRTVSKIRAERIECVNLIAAGNEGLAKVNVPPTSPRDSIDDENDVFQPTRNVAMERNKSADVSQENLDVGTRIELVLTGNERKMFDWGELVLCEHLNGVVSAGDWLVQDYDILTDAFVSKVYDERTFRVVFKQALN